MSVSTAAVIFGLVAGGGLSLATRSRYLLAGGALLLTIVHAATAAVPVLGLLALPLVAGVLRLFVYVAVAEELDQTSHVWKAVVMGVLLYGATNAGSFFASIIASAAVEVSPTLSHAVPVLGAVAALIPCVVLALAMPGAPFRWTSDETLVPPTGPQAPYRPEPQVARPAGAPSPWILALALGAMFFSNCTQSVQGEAANEAMFHDAPSHIRWAAMVNPVTVIAVGFFVAVAGVYLASTRARVSPTWGIGAGLGLQVLSAVVAAIAFSGHSTGLSVGATLLDGLGEGIAAPIALGYVIGTLSSRWVGLAAAGFGIVNYLPHVLLSPILGRQTALMPLLGLTAVLTLAAAALVLVLGPRLNRGNTPAA
jgi:hypothetical protein